MKVDKAYVLNRYQLFYVLISIVVIWLAVSLLAFFYLHSRVLNAAILLILFFPLLFIKRIINFYSREIFIFSLNETINIKSERLNNSYEKETDIKLEEIDSYLVQFPTRRFSEILFILKSGKKVRLSFLRLRNQDEKIDTDMILNSFHSLIGTFNSKRPQGERINLLPTYYASRGGLIGIYALCVLLAVDISLHISFSPKTLPISLILFVSIILQLIIRRKADLEYYNKIVNPHE